MSDDNKPSIEANHKVFFIGPDLTNPKEATNLVDPCKPDLFHDLYAAFGRACSQMLFEETGMTRGQILQKAMEQPPVPYEPQWEDTNLFCPYCGVKGLKVEPGDGDFYQGPRHKCEACDQDCYLP